MGIIGGIDVMDDLEVFIKCSYSYLYTRVGIEILYKYLQDITVNI